MLDEVGNNIDHQSEAHEDEKEGDDRVDKRQPTHRGRDDGNVRCLIAHGDRERVVHEISIVDQILVSRELQSLLKRTIVRVIGFVVIACCVMHSVISVDQQPRGKDTNNR